jgi:hypothetical protein
VYRLPGAAIGTMIGDRPGPIAGTAVLAPATIGHGAKKLFRTT